MVDSLSDQQIDIVSKIVLTTSAQGPYISSFFKKHVTDVNLGK